MCRFLFGIRNTKIPCFREFLREFFTCPLPISSLSAQNPQIFRFAEGMEQGITGISVLSRCCPKTYKPKFARMTLRSRELAGNFRP
jgi:hypothetical protein